MKTLNWKISFWGKLMAYSLFIPVVMYAQSDGWVKITTNPVNAQITIDGQIKGTTPDSGPMTIKLSAGKHSLQIYYKDYEEYNVEIIIPPGEVVEKDIVLNKITGFRLNPEEEKRVQQGLGKITVVTEPADATVYIDGEKIDKQPPFTGETGAGRHNIKAVFVIKEPVGQIVEIEKEIRIQAGDVTTVYFDIREKIGKLTVIAVAPNNENCVIYINDKYVNEHPPFTAFITAGQHKVKAEFTIQRPVIKKIPITRNVFINVGLNTRMEFNLEEMTGYLTVNSNQENSEIYINEQYFGLTPLSNSLIGTGSHEILIKKEGYTEYRDKITVKSRQNSYLNARLKKLASLSVKTLPEGGNIVINGKDQKTDSWTGTIEPLKEIKIIARKPLYEDWEQTIIPGVGEEINITAELQYYSGLLKINKLIPYTIMAIKGKKFKLQNDEIRLPIGKYDYELSKPGHIRSSGKFEIVRNKTTQINGLIKKKSLGAAFTRSMIMPGWGELYQEKSGLRWLYIPAFLGSCVFSYLKYKDYESVLERYKTVRGYYTDAFEPEEIIDYRTLMYNTYDEIKKKENIRNLAYGIAGAIYIINLLDVIILPPGWKNKVNVNAAMKGGNAFGSIQLSLN